MHIKIDTTKNILIYKELNGAQVLDTNKHGEFEQFIAEVRIEVMGKTRYFESDIYPSTNLTEQRFALCKFLDDLKTKI